MSQERGAWRNKEYAKQLITFTGLQLGTKTPTDIDLFYDIGGKLFIIGETKFKGTDVPWGQQLAIERLCDGLEQGAGPTIAFITAHKTPHDQEIMMADTVIESYRRSGVWKEPTKTTSLKDGIRLFINKVGDAR